MKKFFTFILTGVLTAIFLVSCQATPEKPVVIQKDTEQMIEAVKSNTDKTLTEMVNSPERMRLSVRNGNGTVKVNADAQVLVPETDGIATLRVRKREFTQVEADKVLQYFIGGNAFNSNYVGDQDDMVELLLRFKADLANETDPEKRAQLQASIEKFEKAGVTIPDGPQEIIPASKVFAESKPGGRRIEGYSETQGNKIFIKIVNNPEMNEYRVLYTQEQIDFAVDRGTYWEEAEISHVSNIGLDAETMSRLPLSITAEQAQKTAAQALGAMGIEEMTLAYCTEVWGGGYIRNDIAQGRHAFRLEYVRQAGGVPITYSEFGIETGALYETNEGGYAAGWPYECVHFIIDDKGIAEFIWESPYEITETVAEHSALMPFGEIQGVFEKMMPITNAYTGGVTVTFNITRVQLGLMRITEKDSTDTALLIPVWDFFGTYITDDGEGGSYVNEDICTSRLTINAVDGSIIDRGVGY